MSQFYAQRKQARSARARVLCALLSVYFPGSLGQINIPKQFTWNVTEARCRMEVMPEPVKRIDSGFHVKLRCKLKEVFLYSTTLHR